MSETVDPGKRVAIDWLAVEGAGEVSIPYEARRLIEAKLAAYIDQMTRVPPAVFTVHQLNKALASLERTLRKWVGTVECKPNSARPFVHTQSHLFVHVEIEEPLREAAFSLAISRWCREHVGSPQGALTIEASELATYCQPLPTPAGRAPAHGYHPEHGLIVQLALIYEACGGRSYFHYRAAIRADDATDYGAEADFEREHAMTRFLYVLSESLPARYRFGDTITRLSEHVRYVLGAHSYLFPKQRLTKGL
ncbi:MAG: hypothetical protein R3D27_03395 [Hyphomicrobiaceae bacterium]